MNHPPTVPVEEVRAWLVQVAKEMDGKQVSEYLNPMASDEDTARIVCRVLYAMCLGYPA